MSKDEIPDCPICGKTKVRREAASFYGEWTYTWYDCPDRCALAAGLPERDAGPVTKRENKQSLMESPNRPGMPKDR